MSEKVFYPHENIRHKGYGILLFNHAGSNVSQDTGRDAQHLAERFNLPVIAADRPGSGYASPSFSLRNNLGQDYVTAMGSLLQPVEDICRYENIQRLILAGRSAGGTAAVAFAVNSEFRHLTLRGIYTAEMAGCGLAGNNTPEERRIARRAHWNYTHEKEPQLQKSINQLIQPVHHDLHGIEALRRGASILICNANDYFNNDKVWGSAVAIDCARVLAADAPSMYQHYEFAEFSAVAKQTTIDRLDYELSALRPDEAAPVIVAQPPNTTHASFDNRDYFADRLSSAVDYTLAS